MCAQTSVSKKQWLSKSGLDGSLHQRSVSQTKFPGVLRNQLELVGVELGSSE